MKLNSLKLINFRNYHNVKFNPSSGINILYGFNGSGKTNIVEAIYILALSKSFRTLNEKILINNNEQKAKIEGNFLVKNRESSFKIFFDGDGKTVFINNEKIKLLSDYISKINIVLFSPSDLKIIKDSPGFRRKFLNIEISQFNKEYLFCIANYNKLLKQRNAYLKQLSTNYNNSFEYLDIITKKIIDIGLKINKYRTSFVDKLNSYISDFYFKIAGVSNIKIVYDSSFNDEDASTILEAFKKNRIRELNFGKTLIGIHLDDFKILIDDLDIKDYGSEGQQKNAVLAIKFAEIELFKKVKGESPILILDDLFSELDLQKINNIFKLISDGIQTFITTTDVNKIDKEIIKKSKLIKITNGCIEEVLK